VAAVRHLRGAAGAALVAAIRKRADWRTKLAAAEAGEG
jgi:hypothetical protein